MTIGEVAARLGLAPSTLRWWEKQGLVGPPERRSGRRRYDERDLRLLAQIQIWQETSQMSLADIGTMLARMDANQDWQEVVHERIARLDAQLTRLRDARANLAHMLHCPRADPLRDCPQTREVIDRHLAARADGTRPTPPARPRA